MRKEEREAVAWICAAGRALQRHRPTSSMHVKYLLRSQPMRIMKDTRELIGRVELPHVDVRHQPVPRRANVCMLCRKRSGELLQPPHGNLVARRVRVQKDRAATKPAA
eukprot:scaffold9088_cov118-Isochrysis_galbana.AAC.3